MTNPSVDRKLAALLFSDIKGYSSQMDKDEEGALGKLAIHNAIFDRQVEEHGGRTIKTVGDAYMIEFPSAVNAVRCGLDVQRELGTHNDSALEEDQIWVRMGIHFGDVIIKGDDLFGETVNIAARLEPKAPAGAICISQAVYNQVRRKVEAKAQDMGQVSLKNIKEPFQLYALTPSKETLDLPGGVLVTAATQTVVPSIAATPARRSPMMFAGWGVAVIIVGVLVWYIGFGPGSVAEDAGLAPTPTASADAGATAAATDASTGTTNAPQGPVRGGVLRLGVEGQRETTFDLTQRVRSVNGQVLFLVYDSLLRYDPEADSLVPGIIAKWELSDDARLLTLHLREGIWFHPHKCLGGKTRKADSADVVFSIGLAQKIERTLPIKGLSAFLAGKADHIEGVTVGADGAVALAMDKPTAWAVHNIASDRLYPKELASCGDLTSMEKPPGTGPFRVADSKPGFHFRLSAWNKYWDKAPDGKPFPYLDAVDISVVSDTVTSVSRLAKAALDVVEMPDDAANSVLDEIGTDRPKLKKRFPISKLNISAEYPSARRQVLQAIFFLPGDGRPPLKEAVRKAIATSLDIEKLAPLFTVKMTPAGRFLDSSMEGYDAGLRVNVHDTAGAKKLLADAGMPEGVADFTFGHYPELRNVAEKIRTQAAAAGIKMRLVQLSSVAMSKAIRKRLVDAFLSRWLSPNTNQEPYPYLHGLANLLGSVGWKDPTLAALAQTIMSEPKRTKRAVAYRKLEAHLVDKAYILPLARPAKRQPRAFWLARPPVSGLTDRFTGRVRLTAGTLLQYVWLAK